MVLVQLGENQYLKEDTKPELEEAHQSLLDPEEYDWETDGNGNIKIKWITKAPCIIQYSKILQILEFFSFFFDYTFFCEQLESGLSPQSCLYFQGFRGSMLLNGSFIVLLSNLCLGGIQ